MKGIIIYKGRYGATRQYAGWIAEELGVPVMTFDAVSDQEIASTRFVIICSSVYVGRLLIHDWIKKHAVILQNKKLYLAVVCGTPSSEKARQKKILEDNIDRPILRLCDSFFLPGRLVIGKLSRKDRFILKLGAFFEKDPVKRAAMTHNVDGVKKENIDALVRKVRDYTSGKGTGLQDEIPIKKQII